MNFRKAIYAYQSVGDESAVRRTLEFVWRDEAVGEDDGCYLRVAAQIKKSSAAFLHESMYDPEALPEYRAAIFSGTGVDIADARPDWTTVLSYLGAEEFSALGAAFRAEMDYRTHLDTVIKPALGHAFKHVDVGEQRSIAEIVTYVRRAFLTEYSRLDREQTGIIRLGRKQQDGDFYSLYVTPRPPQPWRMILGREVDEAEVPELLARLTRKQRDYVVKAHVVITEDVASGTMREYKVDEHGLYRIKARYMAQRLGTNEGSLKKLLIRVQERTG